MNKDSVVGDRVAGADMLDHGQDLCFIIALLLVFFFRIPRPGFFHTAQSWGDEEEALGLCEFSPGAEAAVGRVGERRVANDDQRPSLFTLVTGRAVEQVLAAGLRFHERTDRLGNVWVDELGAAR